MSTDVTDQRNRLPTAGPEQVRYDEFQFQRLAGENGLICHAEADAQWIETGLILALDEWR